MSPVRAIPRWAAGIRRVCPLPKLLARGCVAGSYRGAMTGRQRRLSVVTLALCLLVSTLAPPASADEYAEAVGREALEQIDYPIENLGWTVAFLPGKPGFLGLAIGPKRRIEIYVRSSHGVSDVAHTLAHELGHAVDLTYGSDYRRSEYLRMRG